MTNTESMKLAINFALIVTLAVGCNSNDGDKSPGSDSGSDQKVSFECPAEMDALGTTCSVASSQQCKYLAESCPPYEVYNVCSCENGKWSCLPDCYDCCKNWDAGNVPPKDTAADGPASGDTGPGDAGFECPAKANDLAGNTCAVANTLECKYLLEKCPPYEVYTVCRCTNGKWNCGPDCFDCCN